MTRLAANGLRLSRVACHAFGNGCPGRHGQAYHVFRLLASNVTVKGLHASEKLSNCCLPADTSGSLRHLSDHDLLRAEFANACVVVHYSFKQRNCTPQFESLLSLLSVTKDGV